MNKKILFFIIIGVLIMPVLVSATTLDGMINQLKTKLITIGGGVVIIGWIIAGILWLTAAGNPNKMALAKGATIAAVVGTILVVVASGSGVVIDIIKDIFAL